MIYLLSPRSGGPFKQLQLIAKTLNARGFDAKHCYTPRDWIRLHFNRNDKIVSVVPLLFVANRKNFILNIRGNYLKERRLANPLSYFYDRNLRLASHTVVPSQYLKKELGLDEATIIPTSTDIKLSAPRRTSPPDSSVVRLATITNFDFRPKAQGINKLINIVNQLSTKKQIQIHIYGGGRWLEHAKDQYELHNYKKYPVTFHGHFDNAADVLPGNDIFIYWSTFDNMPNVLIEATACGLPIVVNRYAAYEEIVGTENLLSDSETEFTEQILRLIESPDMRGDFSKMNERRASLFNINTNIKQWIDVIQPTSAPSKKSL
jgi:glycosyltransferase involved in cell wall biosynthesis